MRFEDFVLQLDTSSRGGFRARVLKSPCGEGSVGFSLASVAGAGSAALDVSGISRGSRELDDSPGGALVLVAQPPLEIGTELYRSVFQGQVRTLLDKTRGQLDISPDVGLRLKIKIDPTDAETGALADLPWELLCDGETEDFFALSRRTSLVRYLDVPRSSQPIPFTPPLRILAVGASPHSLQPLDLEEEVRRLEELNQSSTGVEVRFLAHASAGAVREALSGDTYNVLHFMGHGAFDRASGEGMLAFERPDGSADLVSGKAFATKLKDLRSLGVVVLNACNTARAGHQGGASPFRGVATALVLGGVPAVVAMQRPISDRAAIGFSTAFYRHLARGDSIDEALTEGRQAIHSAKPEGFEWATPVLFLRMPDGNVFVARPAEPQEAVKPAVEAPVAPPPPLPVQIAPASPKRGPGIKVVAGAAAGAVLVGVLYVAIPKSGTQPPKLEDGKTAGGSTQLTTETPIDPNAGKSKRPAKVTGKDHPAGNSSAEKKDSTLTGGAEPKAPLPSTPPPVASTPAVEAALKAPAPTADLSSLSAQVVAIEPQAASIHVTVAFKNTSSQKRLSVTFDGEGSFLSDGGQRYSILGFSLPSPDSNPRLDLAPNESSRSTFDFQAPKLGSKQFSLKLVTLDGRPVPVSP
ncbi:MAG: CHAT domain-containing protein [Acidobacteria bacterium]|nr:CHAT domain-containing protein [Acidobacteriota bacterium]